MIRPIEHDLKFLEQKAQPATKKDQSVINDLLETLVANQHTCLGMAANMIGQNKQIIALFIGPLPIVMLNLVIKQKAGPYHTSEGCLSLAGQKKTLRYQKITVSYLNRDFQPQQQTFSNLTAQIIQHEIDHCNGRLI